MNKQDSALVGYFTFILVLTITCGFSKPSQNCWCKEFNNVNQFSLPEKTLNNFSMWGPVNFDSTMTASGTVSELVSPSSSPEFFGSDVS